MIALFSLPLAAYTPSNDLSASFTALGYVSFFSKIAASLYLTGACIEALAIETAVTLKNGRKCMLNGESTRR
jgi:hypothetical protein